VSAECVQLHLHTQDVWAGLPAAANSGIAGVTPHIAKEDDLQTSHRGVEGSRQLRDGVARGDTKR
jgi:hypothetical protein